MFVSRRCRIELEEDEMDAVAVCVEHAAVSAASVSSLELVRETVTSHGENR